MAVAFRASSVSGAGESWTSSLNVPVPAGAQAGDIALLSTSYYGSATITWPAGFTEFVSQVSGSLAIRTAWKRLTAADTGSYTVAWSATGSAHGIARLYSGGIASGDPVEDAAAGTSNGTSSPNLSVTTTVDGCALDYYLRHETAGATTPPTGYTERQDANKNALSTREVTTAGAYNSAGGTQPDSWPAQALLVAIKPDGGTTPPQDKTGGGASTVTVTVTGAGSATEQADAGSVADLTVAATGAGAATEAAGSGAAATVTTGTTTGHDAAETATGGGAASVTVAATSGYTYAEAGSETGGGTATVATATSSGYTATEHATSGASPTVAVATASGHTAVEDVPDAHSGGSVADILTTTTSGWTVAEYAAAGEAAALRVLATTGWTATGHDVPAISAARTHHVGAESRVHVVVAEDRRHLVRAENRTTEVRP